MGSNHFRFRGILGAMALATIFGCTQKKSAPEKHAEALPGRVHPLQTYFEREIPANEPGLAVLVMAHDSTLFSGGFGLADLTIKKKADANTLFNLGSISKTFVANAILILEERKQLALTDPLEKYFPDFANKPIAKKVQLRHLLTHTSGLPDIRFPYRDSVFYLTAKDVENWAPITKAQHLNFEPGAKFEYSNPAFNGLALVIESVTGMKWQTFVQNEIMAPAGMLTSTITDGAHPQTGVAHGYIFSGGKWVEKDYMEEPTFAAAGNGGVWSSVSELARYHQGLKNARFLPKSRILESFEQKTFSNWQSKTPLHIGWSWFVEKSKSGLKTVGHTGSQGGFRANYVYVPEKDWLVVLLSSAPRPLEKFTEECFVYLERAPF